MHLDISQNRFNSVDSQIIADGLSKNNSLYGIHFIGNKGSVDSNGFINPNSLINMNLNDYYAPEKIDGKFL